MERKLGPKLQLLIRGYEEAKRQHHQLRAVLFSGAAVMHIGGHLGDLLGCDGRPTALSPSTARAAVEAFEEAEASYRPIKPLLPEMWVTEAAALATVVGVLIEVPVMLSVVRIVRGSRGWYERGLAGGARR